MGKSFELSSSTRGLMQANWKFIFTKEKIEKEEKKDFQLPVLFYEFNAVLHVCRYCKFAVRTFSQQQQQQKRENTSTHPSELRKREIVLFFHLSLGNSLYSPFVCINPPIAQRSSSARECIVGVSIRARLHTPKTNAPTIFAKQIRHKCVYTHLRMRRREGRNTKIPNWKMSSLVKNICTLFHAEAYSAQLSNKRNETKEKNERGERERAKKNIMKIKCNRNCTHRVHINNDKQLTTTTAAAKVILFCLLLLSFFPLKSLHFAKIAIRIFVFSSAVWWMQDELNSSCELCVQATKSQKWNKQQQQQQRQLKKPSFPIVSANNFRHCVFL